MTERKLFNAVYAAFGVVVLLLIVTSNCLIGCALPQKAVDSLAQIQKTATAACDKARPIFKDLCGFVVSVCVAANDKKCAKLDECQAARHAIDNALIEVHKAVAGAAEIMGKLKWIHF